MNKSYFTGTHIHYLHQGGIVFMTIFLFVCFSAVLHKYYSLDFSLKSHKLDQGLSGCKIIITIIQIFSITY